MPSGDCSPARETNQTPWSQSSTGRPSRLDRQARLAAPAQPHQRQQPAIRVLQPFLDLRELRLASNKRDGLHRQVVPGTLGGCARLRPTDIDGYGYLRRGQTLEYFSRLR